MTDALRLAVHEAVARVDDPEYPGVSIVDLGLLEAIDVGDLDPAGSHHVTIGLVPTFSGCPALAIISADVDASVRTVDGVGDVEVRWLTTPAWDVSRISHDARGTLAREFTVAVEITGRAPSCPLCGSPTAEHSMFGPSRCRSVHRCTSCSETVEVVRS